MSQITILFVDDEQDVRTSVAMGLENYGINVVTASSAEQALELLQSIEPALIITDLRMKQMNGFEFFQRVRNISKFKTIPVFFLTAIDDYIAQKYRHDLGVDTYITKPIDIEELYKIIISKLSHK